MLGLEEPPTLSAAVHEENQVRGKEISITRAWETQCLLWSSYREITWVQSHKRISVWNTIFVQGCFLIHQSIMIKYHSVLCGDTGSICLVSDLRACKWLICENVHIHHDGWTFSSYLISRTSILLITPKFLQPKRFNQLHNCHKLLIPMVMMTKNEWKKFFVVN